MGTTFQAPAQLSGGVRAARARESRSHRTHMSTKHSPSKGMAQLHPVWNSSCLAVHILGTQPRFRWQRALRTSQVRICANLEPSKQGKEKMEAVSLESETRGNAQNQALIKLMVTSCLSMLQFGYTTGIIAGVLLYISSDVQFATITTLGKSILVGSVTIGAMFGALLAAPLSNKFGRRWTLLSTNAFYILGSLGSALAPSLGLLVGSRFLCGVGAGVCTATTTVYIAESVPSARRGELTGWSPFIGTTGILCSYFVSLALGPLPFNWRWMMSLGVIPAVLQLFLGGGLDWLPDTPRWLASKGQLDKAREVQQMLGLGTTLSLPTATEVPENQAPGALWIGGMINFFQQFSGINVVVYFAPTILTQAGFGREVSIVITAFIGIMQLCSNYAFTRVVDKFGRLPLAYLGLAGICLGQLALSLSFAPLLQGYAWIPWMAVVGIVLFRICFSMSMGPLPYIITAEIFPSSVRSTGVALSSAINWLCNFLVSMSFLPLLEVFTSQYVWFLYIAMNIGAALFIYTFVPEMKGKAI